VSDQPPAPLLPADELYVLCHWACEALAADLSISVDDAKAALAVAESQGRVQVLGNGYFAGVQCDDRWVVVEGRARITQATHEWQTLCAMEQDLR
jgi:hypothetical protein